MLLWVKSFHLEHDARRVDIAPVLINNGLKIQHLLTLEREEPRGRLVRQFPKGRLRTVVPIPMCRCSPNTTKQFFDTC